MAGSLQTLEPARERRVEPRQFDDLEVWLFLRGELCGRARLVERSPGGMRLKGIVHLIEKADKLLIPSSGNAYDIEVAWSVGFNVGLTVRRYRRLWGAFAEPEFDTLRRVWLQPSPFFD